jgi:hypothetical protein
MTSSINPNNIDGAYPVAGQDNDSQGFRDNFTNTKTNFQYAAAEINDLQSKVLLKSALNGSTLDNNMAGALLYGAKIQDFSATRVAGGVVPGVGSSTITIDYAAGHYQTLTTDNSITLAFINFPAAGSAGWVRIQMTISSSAHTVTLPSAVSVGTSNLQGYSSNVITFNQAGTYEFEFVTNDGGTTVSIFDLNRNRDPIYLPSAEDLAASAGASLTKTVSYFSTTGAETATLAAGVAGQVKVFAMYATTGNMVITVTNAGWKTSGTGTITFSTIGQACTLEYINNKWFAIGNNGCVFA